MSAEERIAAKRTTLLGGGDISAEERIADKRDGLLGGGDKSAGKQMLAHSEDKVGEAGKGKQAEGHDPLESIVKRCVEKGAKPKYGGISKFDLYNNDEGPEKGGGA